MERSNVGKNGPSWNVHRTHHVDSQRDSEVRRRSVTAHSVIHKTDNAPGAGNPGVDGITG
jgi:hypothetical protein